MDNTYALLFNELYIEFLKGIFLEKSEKKMSVRELRDILPAFYANTDLINTGIGLLLRQKFLEQFNEGGEDLYKVSRRAITTMEAKESDRQINEKIDLYIKTETANQLQLERFQKKYWWLISAGTILLSGIVSWIVAHYSK